MVVCHSFDADQISGLIGHIVAFYALAAAVLDLELREICSLAHS